MSAAENFDTPYLAPVTCCGCGWQGRRRAYIACANTNLRHPCPSCGLRLVEPDIEIDPRLLAGMKALRATRPRAKEPQE